MKDRLKIFGEYHAGTWGPVERLHTPVTRTRFNEQTHTVTDLPAFRELHTFTTSEGAVYTIERPSPSPRADHPVSVRGVWTVEGAAGFVPGRLIEHRDGKPFVLFDLDRGRGFNTFRLVNRDNPEEQTRLTRAGEPYTESGKTPFVEIEFPDGTLEIATVRITQTAPAVQSEVERIAAMNIREAVEVLMRHHADVDAETLQIGIRHMNGQTWTQIQKDMKRSRATVKDRIDFFYRITGFPRPDRKHGKGKRVQFDDNRDLPEHKDTRPAQKKRTVSRTVRG